MDARRALLGGLIHHAPTFPPARLPTDAALAEDERAGRSDDGWILGPLIWPASRLGELEVYGVPVGAVLDAPLPATTARVEWVETRWPGSPTFHGEVFVELPIDAELEPNRERVPAAGARVKVRCGGERTPEPGGLARFVQACAAVGVAFKASAGLHHGVRTNSLRGFGCCSLAEPVQDPRALRLL